MPMRSPTVASSAPYSTMVMKPTPARRLSDSSSSGLHTAETWATADSGSDDEYSSSIPASPSLDSATTGSPAEEPSAALTEKDRRIEQLQRALDAAIRQIESLHTDRQALKQQAQQDKKTIAMLEQEVAELRKTKTATATSTSTSQPECRNDNQHKDTNDGNHNDNHHHDNQVRDQIAAVKATLKQGSHQAKANHVSLSQELETSRRLRQKLANRKAARMSSPPASPKKPRNITSSTTTTSNNNNKKLSLTEQVAALVASVQEREQYMAEIAQTFSSDKSKAGTIPVSLYQAEIQQWKHALHKLQNATPDNDNNSNTELLQETLRQSNQLLQQANEKLHQLETALSEAQQESKESQLRAGTLFQVVQKLQRDKEEEIHLLDIVMQHLIDLEEEGK